MMQSALRDLLVSTPSWVMAGATVDLDFLNSRYYQVGSGGGPSNLITCSRASVGYADDQAGNWSSFASNLPRITNKGLLVEESRTNGIRNSSMQGAVVGTLGAGGAPPNNWNINNSSSLTASVVSVGVQNGIDIITINLSGTTGSSGPFFQMDFEGNSVIAALQNQVWSPSFWAQYSNTTNITGGFIVVQTNAAGGSNLAQDVALNNTTTTFTRLSGNVTLANASAAWVKPFLKITFTASSAVNVNVTIGGPQLELGASVTSPIRTTSAAATRAADAVSLTKVPAFGSGQSLFFKGNPSTPTGYGVFQGGIIAHDGGNSNRIQIIRVNATGKDSFLFSGSGVIGLSIDGSVTAQNASFRAALASTSGSLAYADGGGSFGTSSSTDVPAGSSLTAVRIGDQSSSRQFDGYVERIAIWASTRISDADLKRIVQ